MNILIVSDKANFTASLDKLIKSTFECETTTCSTALLGRNHARENIYDVIIVNSPIGGGLGDDFVKSLTHITYSAIMVLVPAEISETFSKKVMGNGIFVINKPLSKNDFIENFKNALITSERSKILFNENLELKLKMEEMKKVERAKVLLVEYLKLSEPQAHKYISQQAMELRKTKGEIAQNIINTYEI